MFGGMPVKCVERLIAGSASFPRRLSPSFTPYVANGPTRQRILNNSGEIDGQKSGAFFAGHTGPSRFDTQISNPHWEEQYRKGHFTKRKEPTFV